MLAALPEVSVHFSRFRVTEISLSNDALGQFDLNAQLTAAELLADAKCDVICWNGTSASWLGLDQDRELCQAISERTGIRACSAVLALDEVFRVTGVRRYGLVSPYIEEIQSRIVATLAGLGYACAAERGCGIRVNYDFALVSQDAIAQMVREAARDRPDAITILCTNMCGAPLAATLERETGIPVYDSIALAMWASLRAAGIDTRRIEGWGGLFRRNS
jgi:maleate isomerase